MSARYLVCPSGALQCGAIIEGYEAAVDRAKEDVRDYGRDAWIIPLEAVVRPKKPVEECEVVRSSSEAAKG